MIRKRLILWVACLLTGAVATAGTLDKDDFLVSQDYSSSEQNNPSVAVGLDGRFAVIWTDYRNGNSDIFCRLYDSGAVEIGDNFILNDDNSGAWQFEPDLASDWYGNYYAVWKDYRNNAYPFDPDIYFQRLDSAGFFGDNINITTEPPDSSHQSPAVGAAGWGRTVVTWTDLRHFNWDVFVQNLEIDGTSIGPNRQVNDDNSATPQHEPDIALSAEGWFVVVWYDGRNGNDDIYLQKFDSAGNVVGANIRINDDGTSSKQKFPAVAIGGNGVIYVVWTDWRNGSYPDNPDIYWQRLDADLNRLGSNTLINMDGAQTAQRDPRVAADRMGNACVVWSDSSSAGWDIKAQMFDAAGYRRDANFSINQEAGGKQLHPDLALDGYNLYAVWADDRSGNYDIYGRLIQYNFPALTAVPARLDISKDKNDPEPTPVLISVSNAGYGELDYAVESDCEWLSLSKISGTTPDSFYVSINSSGLDYGLHQGRIKTIDITHNDSTAFIPVILTVTGPEISIVPELLNFKALTEIGSPAEQTIRIDNDGSGTLNFSLSTSAAWLTLDKTTGTDDEIVHVGCDVSSLTMGNYGGFVIVSDDGALNSPESLLVTLDLESNQPYLASLPPEILLNVNRGETVSDSIRIVNLGTDSISWTAASDAPWLILQATSGGDNDYILYALEASSLQAGVYYDSIVVEDTTAFNNPLIIPFTLTVAALDSIVISSAQAAQGQTFQIPIYLHNHNIIQAGIIQLGYDRSMLAVDSVGAPIGAAIDGLETAVDSAAAAVTIIIPLEAGAKRLIDPGYYHLGDIYARAADTLSGTTGFTAFNSPDSFYLKLADGTDQVPQFIAGEIEISIPSAVDDGEDNSMPSRFFLGQNSPNPFNGATIINFGLKRGGPIRLEVFNILGQIVDVLVDGYFPAGRHQARWDGRDLHGRGMATGLYFYRVTTPEFTAVRKMVYLK